MTLGLTYNNDWIQFSVSMGKALLHLGMDNLQAGSSFEMACGRNIGAW